jgi:hypothetical protein
MSTRWILGIVVLAGLSAGCTSVPHFTRAGEPHELLAAPPAGKALVNFHRPSGFGGGVDLPVFDGTTLIGNSLGKTRFQYVCDSGEHVFIARRESVSVVQAHLLGDQVYDVVTDVGLGWWSANIQIEPITKLHERRGELAKWEGAERLLVPVRDDAALAYEERQCSDIEVILEDFLGGAKSDRLRKLEPDDHR